MQLITNGTSNFLSWGEYCIVEKSNTIVLGFSSLVTLLKLFWHYILYSMLNLDMAEVRETWVYFTNCAVQYIYAFKSNILDFKILEEYFNRLKFILVQDKSYAKTNCHAHLIFSLSV